MRQSSRLIINTAITYARMALGFVIGILLTRELLRGLGEIDYGLFMSVGAAWALLNIFLASLHTSGQRHLAHAVGLGDSANTRRTFSCLCVANGIMAIVATLIGLVAADWVLNGLDIPPNRAVAASYIYYLGLSTLVVMTALSPFASALLANQQFVSLAAIDICDRLLLLAAVFGMMLYEGDKLIYWTITYTLIQISFGVGKSLYAVKCLHWARIRIKEVTWQETKKILFFANWLLASNTIMRVRLQGTLLLFNYFFGNTVAAAQGVTMQLVSYQNQMAFALTQVVAPVLTGQAARNNLKEFHRLILLYSKFATLSAALISVVLLVEVDIVLEIWLSTVPPYTAQIAWWTLVLFLFNKSVVGYTVALQARAKMAGLVLLVQLPELLSLAPIVLYLVRFDAEPWHVPAAFAGVNAFLTLVVLPLYGGRILELPVRRWITTTAIPLTSLLLTAYFSVWCLRLLLIPGLLRVLCGFAINGAILGIGGWCICLNEEDRETLRQFVRTVYERLCRRRQPNEGRAAESLE